MVSGKWLLFTALLALAVPSALAAQQAGASEPHAGAPSEHQVQQWVAELQQLDGRLGEIQGEAMQDAALQSAQTEIGEQIQAAMEVAEPELPQLMERMGELEQEAQSAQQAGEQAKLQELAREAEQIQGRIVKAQREVFQEPGMAGRLQEFQDRLEARMAEVDPEAPQMIERFRELEGRLAAAMAGAPSR